MRRLTRVARAIATASFALALGACTINHRVLRPAAETRVPAAGVDATGRCATGVVDGGSWRFDPCPADGTSPFASAVIEFDDHGDLWQPAQLKRAEELVAAFADRQILFVGFIHGWRHNAAADDSNFTAFAAVLEELRKRDLCKVTGGSTGRCAIVGVYFAWRGDPLGGGPLSFLSFWNRKAAARGSSDVLASHALATLTARIAAQDRARWRHAAADDARALQGYTSEASRTLVIGHSFGARFLEAALAQTMIGRQEIADRIDLQWKVAQFNESARERSSLLGAVDELLCESERAHAAVRAELGFVKDKLGRLEEEANAQPGDTELQAGLDAAFSPHRLDGFGRDVDRLMADVAPTLAAIESKIDSCNLEGDEERTLLLADVRDRIDGLRAASRAFDTALAGARGHLVPDLDYVRPQCTNATTLIEWSHDRSLANSENGFTDALRALRRSAAAAHRAAAMCGFDFKLDNLFADPVLGFDVDELRFDSDGRRERISNWQLERRSAVDDICDSGLALQSLDERKSALERTELLLRDHDARTWRYARRASDSMVADARRSRTDLSELLIDALELTRPPIDLALMVNPATEGLRAEQLSKALADWSLNASAIIGGQHAPSPFLVQVASTSDWTTHRLYPLASRVGEWLRLQGSARNDPDGQTIDLGLQATLLRRPAPQSARALTHRLCFDGPMGEANSASTAPEFARAFHEALSATPDRDQPLDAFFFPVGEQRGQLDPDEHGECGLHSAHAQLPQAIAPVRPPVPIWIVSGDEDFMPTHDDLFGRAIGGLSGALLRRSSMFTYRCSADTASDPDSICAAFQTLDEQQARLDVLAIRASKPPGDGISPSCRPESMR